MNNIDFNIQLGEDVQVVKPKYNGIQNWSCEYKIKGHGHLDLITSGNIEIHYKGKKYFAGPNTILCIPKDIEYFFKVRGNYSYYSFFFEYTTNTESNDFLFPLCYEPANIKYFKEKYKEAYNHYIIKSWGYKIKIQEIFFDVFAKLNDEYFNTITCSENYTIKKSVDYIHENFSNPELNTSDIASFSEISDTHFRRLFKTVYGTTPIKYINNLRINKAKTMLSTSNITIEEIATQCGYNDYSYFIRVFTKTTGHTPLKYRTRNSRGIIY